MAPFPSRNKERDPSQGQDSRFQKGNITRQTHRVNHPNRRCLLEPHHSYWSEDSGGRILQHSWGYCCLVCRLRSALQLSDKPSALHLFNTPGKNAFLSPFFFSFCHPSSKNTSSYSTTTLFYFYPSKMCVLSATTSQG